MGRFEPTGPVEVPGLKHSVANLNWGVLTGAHGPSDGSAGAGSNVPSALGVLRHAVIYANVPEEIEEAFVVLEQHVMRDGQLYPVALAALPFLFDTMRRGSPIGARVTDLIARYATLANTLDPALSMRLLQIVADHAGEVARWFGTYDRALGALAMQLPALREVFLASVEGAENISPEALLVLIELGDPVGDSEAIAVRMLDAGTDIARMCAAAFLARFGDHAADLRERIDSALPPSAPGALRRHVAELWTPTVVRPTVAPKLHDAEVVFSGKKLVVVRASGKSVTLPWVDAGVAKGDRLQVGLTAHGQPKLAVVTDWKGAVRVIDFDATPSS